MSVVLFAPGQISSIWLIEEALTPTLNFNPLGSPSLSGVAFKVSFRFAILVMFWVKNPPDLTTFSQALPGLSSSILPSPDRKDFLRVPTLLGSVRAKVSHMAQDNRQERETCVAADYIAPGLSSTPTLLLDVVGIDSTSVALRQGCRRRTAL